MQNTTIKVLLIAFICFTITLSTAQKAPLTEHVAPLFEPFKANDTPGIAAAVVIDQEVAYLNAFGLANLTTKEANSIQTKFQLDDMSKQFSVLALLILIDEGKVDLEDDIKDYVSFLPNYDQNIKVKHVLNHTTGLDNFEMVKYLAGNRRQDLLTHDDALKLIATQEKLNAVPGSQFSHTNSNTEIVLMVEIIKSASQIPFDQFMKDRIFTQLNMSNTLISMSHEQIIPNAALSYQNVGDVYQHRDINYDILGASNVYTSVEDLAKWYLVFHNEQDDKLSKLVKKLDTPVKLDNNKPFHANWGEVTYGRSYLHAERGVPKYWQYGLLGGYGANIFRFPNQKITSFAIGNNNQYNGYYAMEMVESLLSDTYLEPAVVDFDQIKTKKMSAKKLATYEGNYWDETMNIARRVYVKEDTLRYANVVTDYEDTMIPLGNNRFQIVVESDDKIIVTFEITDAKKGLSIVSGNSDPSFYTTYIPTKQERSLTDFEGAFFNKNLNTNFTVSLKDGQLAISHLKHGETNLNSIKTDTFSSGWFFMRSIVFLKSNGKVTGFKVKANGIQEIIYNKVS